MKTLACSLFLLVFVTLVARANETPKTTDWSAKIDPPVLRFAAESATGETDFLVYLAEQADVSAAARLKTKLEKGTYVFQKLTEVAQRSQAPLLRSLDEQGIKHQSFWVANMVLVHGNVALMQQIAQRAEVAHILANPKVHFQTPFSDLGPVGGGVDAIEPGVSWIHAPSVWALGFTGQGVIVGGNDTGYRWTHEALKNQYRGWDGSVADHNYNWHDSIHSGGGICGPDNQMPCDDSGHGTHTMGTMVGFDGGSNQIGVAPGAKWIGCRNMDQGNGMPSTYSECFQFFIAPTDLTGANPDPSKAPDVFNNSWGCPASEGCSALTLQTPLENVRAAGIVPIVSAGNAGSACSTVEDPPAIYEAAISVGASGNNNNAIASFSSRGPVTVDGSNRMKPNVTAPGVSIRSSYGTGDTVYQNLSGTSMSGPHTVGTVALIFSAHPELKGNVDMIQTMLEQSAVPLTSSQTCGGVPGSMIPNNTYGWGRIDALAAVTFGQATPTPTPSPTAGVTVTPTPGATATPTTSATPTPGGSATPTPSGTPGLNRSLNISTRLRVDTGGNVGIGGFIVTGTTPRQVLIRGLGPSLGTGVDALPDPALELHGPAGFPTVTNNNWRETQEQEIIATGIPPTNDLESAILATLDPGAYTAILQGNAGAVGVGLVEIYDLTQGGDSKLANLSTRGDVLTGNDVMIAGFILGGGTDDDLIIVRGLGPSLGGLPDPMLELRNSQGALVRANDNWMDDPNQKAIIIAANLQLSNNLESAIAESLAPGAYTAVLSGVNNVTGVGLVEVYDRPSTGPTATPCPSCTPTPTPPGTTPTPTIPPGGTPTPTPPGATPTPTPPETTPTPTPGTCIENFDGVTAPALPANWVASNPVPGDGVLWVTSTLTPDSAPNAAFIPDQNGISDKVLDRVNVTVNSAAAMMSFRNYFNSEMSMGVFWDGGVLEVSTPSISNGDFLDVTDPHVGGTIVSGGYTGEISGDASNPLAGRMAWSGDSGGYIDTLINLGPNLNGLPITLRWRFGSDEAVAAPGWRIDGLSIMGASCP